MHYPNLPSVLHYVIQNQNILVAVPKVPVHLYQYQKSLAYFPKYNMDDYQNSPKTLGSNQKISLKDKIILAQIGNYFEVWQN